VHTIIDPKEAHSCIAAMSSNGIVAVNQTHQTIDSSIYFFEFVRGIPLPNLQPFNGANSHSVVVMDNCTIHHVEVKELFIEAGVLLLFLPPYSPDLTPIELLFSKTKYYLNTLIFFKRYSRSLTFQYKLQ